MKPEVLSFFDTATHTVSYLVSDPATGAAAIIDSVLGYDAASGRTDFKAADQIIAAVSERRLTVAWIIESHVHADHLSAAPYLRAKLGGQVAIGAAISEVQRVFGDIFNVGDGFRSDGRQFDKLFQDGESYRLGSIEARAFHTPGHTPACMSHLIGDALFVGDTLFMPDFGTARCDFPGGDAGQLYDSIQMLLALPAATRMFLCHDYKAPGRDCFAWETTVEVQKRDNIHLAGETSRDDFIAMRTARDASLSMPALILPSVQVNICAGDLPAAEDNGRQYLKIPLNAF
ncbi:MAG: MBL fold metallo-hydrolase [Nisaea sp.]|nr:MBL fold metallo-hydrolase [Nisaea sp.]OUX95478.1 MAG: MBL fold metallo-hydrolase [Candidatus Endolissoclinum sp. TMED26]